MRIGLHRPRNPLHAECAPAPDAAAVRAAAMTRTVRGAGSRRQTDGTNRDWRISARDQHLRTLARDPARLRDGRRVAGADDRSRTCGSSAGHEPPDRRVHRRGGALGAPSAPHDLGLGLAVVLRHRARLRAHRRSHSRRAAGGAALRRRLPLPARGHGDRAPRGRRGGASAPGALARRERRSGRRLARLPRQHDAGDGRVRGRSRRLPHVSARRHGRHGEANRPAPRRAAERLGRDAQGVSPGPVHDPPSRGSARRASRCGPSWRCATRSRAGRWRASR